MEKKIFQVLITIFLFLLSFFSGVFIVGQILGMVKLYYSIPVIILSLLCAASLFFICLKTCKKFILGNSFTTDNEKAFNWSSYVGFLFGVILLIIVLLLPLILWPYSGIRHELAWDAGMYHLPKAAELVVSHSLLDLSIAYGEYPSGFEILIAFSMILNRAGNLIGTTHAFILVFFQLGLFLLLSRFSRLPKGILFFTSVFVFASYDIFRSIESNPFQMLRISAFDIGMNDFFLASVIIALLTFSPIGPNSEAAKLYSREGIGASTLLIIGTKPNGLLIVASMWILVIIYEIVDYSKNRIPINQIIKRCFLPIALSIIGALWVIRNLLIIGRLFYPDTMAIQEFSIFNNINNPFFYKYMDLNIKIVLSFFILSVLLAIFSKKFHWTIPFTFLFLLLSFIITPTSAFFGSTDKPAEIAWRFGLYLLAFLLPVTFYIIDKPVTTILRKWKLGFAILLVIGMIIITGFGSILNSGRIKIIPENHIVLEDQFQESVGVYGYYSAYDYVRKTAHNSVVWVENGMPFYVFGKDLINSISRGQNPNYLVYFQTDWNNSGGYPKIISTPEFENDWQLIYEDTEGRVYERRIH